MPVRRRVNRRNAGEAGAWAGYFQSGFDFFDELYAIGLTDATAEPIAEETWRRIGADVIAQIEALHVGFYPPPRPFWAEEMFGPPSGSKRKSVTPLKRPV